MGEGVYISLMEEAEGQRSNPVFRDCFAPSGLAMLSDSLERTGLLPRPFYKKDNLYPVREHSSLTGFTYLIPAINGGAF
jgi:hypothetical protein